jgi:integrase
MDVGAFINRDDAERTSFKAAAERYEREVLPSQRGRDKYIYVVRRVVEHFGAYSLASISAAMLSAYRDERLKAVGAQTVVHELGAVGRIFKACAMDWGIQLPNGIPTALVRKPRISNARERVLEPGEEDLLMAALDDCASPWPRLAVVLALETAGRQSELLALRWEDIDLKKQTARLRGKDGGVTKNGDNFRDIPLSKAAVAALSEIPRGIRGKVIPLSTNALKLSWQRATARARQAHLHQLLCEHLASHGLDIEAQSAQIRALIYKKKKPLPLAVAALADLEATDKTLDDLHFHDLRHVATTRLAALLQMHELMKVTGHKSSKMVSRYYHPKAEDLALKIG